MGAGSPSGADRAWVLEHLLGDGDMVLYGSLEAGLEDLDPAEVWGGLREAAQAYLAQGDDGTAWVHAHVDGLLARLLARDARFGWPAPFCHRGCRACCHEPVYATAGEARGILAYAHREGVPVDLDRMARQLGFLAFDAQGDHTGESRWNDQPGADQACAFLDPADGSCRVWPVRPLVCRVHLAEATDAHCRTRNGAADPEARAIVHPEWSIVLSAVFTLHRREIRRTLGRLVLDLAQGSGLG